MNGPVPDAIVDGPGLFLGPAASIHFSEPANTVGCGCSQERPEPFESPRSRESRLVS